jgi:lipopolysaccharide export system permease protein
MKIFSRYVFRQSAGALLLILLSLSGVVWIALALRQLDVVTSQGQDTLMLLAMTTLALPNLMAIIAPIALLIAAVHTLNRLNGDSELIVLTAAGATVRWVARPLLALALLVAVAVSLVNHFVMPWSLRLLGEYVLQVRADLLTQVIQPGRFSSPEPNLTFHIRERSLNGELLGLIMHDTREPEQHQSYLAERGRIVKQDGGAYLVMSDGHILRRTDPKEPAQIIAFKQNIVDLARFDQKVADGGDLKPRERYFGELVAPEPGTYHPKTGPGHFRAELHERFSNPLYPIAFAMIALALVGQAHSTRQSRIERIVVAVVAAAGLRLAGMACNNLVMMKTGAVPILYALPLAGIAVSAMLIARNSRPRRGGPLLRDRLADLFSPLAARMLPVRQAAVAGRAGRGG